MKTSAFTFSLITTLAAWLLAGCASQPAHQPVFVAPTGADRVVEQPVPKENIFGAPPGSHLSWVQGYWANFNWRWVWVPGHWEEHQPNAGVWVPGRWDRHGGQWVWRPGHWESP